jgi:hypothetical protein
MQKNKVIFNTTAKRENIMTKLPLKLIVSLSAAFLIIVGSALIWRIETVKGNELAILETFSQGIQQTPLTPRTYIRNSLTENFYHYDLSNKVFVMNNISDSGGETGNGRKDDAYLVQSFDQQDMHISLSVQWRIDPSKIVAMHTSFHAHIGNNQENILEENLIRPNVMRIVKNHATKMTAMIDSAAILRSLAIWASAAANSVRATFCELAICSLFFLFLWFGGATLSSPVK